MKTEAVAADGKPADGEAVVVDIDAEGRLGSGASLLDAGLRAWIERLAGAGEVATKLAETTLLFPQDGAAHGPILVVGTGERAKIDAAAAGRIGGAAAKRLAARPRPGVLFALPGDWPAALGESAVAGAVAGCAGQDLYRGERKLTAPDALRFAHWSESTVAAGAAIGEAVNLARRLVNEPPNKVYPESLADEAASICRELGIEVEVWDRARLEAERCAALLAVSAGSTRDPRLVVMRYRGRAAGERPDLALVGKGVTFDSGGLSIKPSDGMVDMKLDMAGSATVIAAMQAAARLAVPGHILGVVGLVENMLGGSAYKLGDVIRTRSGKTIEIRNTDAEGRVVLADALDVAAQREPARMVDLATLTGACMIALGGEVVGTMSNDAAWESQIREAAERAGELVWSLPMFDFYGEQIRGKVADIKNVGEGRFGGAITAAKFLQEFVRDIPWTHLDIAGPSFADSAKPWIDAGASGVMVRTLVELMRPR